MKKLKNFDRNLHDLLKDAHRWEYTDINDNKCTSAEKKPKLFFTRFQWLLLILSIIIVLISPDGISKDFAGYIISGMSLFVGLLFTLVVSLFDKCTNTDFSKYDRKINEDLYPLGIRLKNFFKKTIVLTLYTAVIAIACISMLALTMMSKNMSVSIDVFDIVKNYQLNTLSFFIKAALLLLYRIVLFYLLLDFIYITKKLITSFYDYMISEIDQIKMK
jgi:hypothetical protein